MNRLPFLDWMRGIAVLIMIPCHTYNAFARPEFRGTAGYILSQSIGGLAAPFFLFLAGVTFAFGLDKMDTLPLSKFARWKALARRGLYIVMLAYLFRFSHLAPHFPFCDWTSFWKVDILNSMGVGILVFSLATFWPASNRPQFMAAWGIAIACVTPLVSGLDLSGWPWQVREYLMPNRHRFPLFPWTAYVAFGISAGLILRRAGRERLEKVLQWGALAGLVLIFAANYAANLPYSLYAKADFWVDSPALVAIRTGIILVTGGVAWLWTEHLAKPHPGWLQKFGQTSLMVYWVHVLMVYGLLWGTLGEKLDIAGTTIATALIIASMVGLTYARLYQKQWLAARRHARSIA